MAELLFRKRLHLLWVSLVYAVLGIALSLLITAVLIFPLSMGVGVIYSGGMWHVAIAALLASLLALWPAVRIVWRVIARFWPGIDEQVFPLLSTIWYVSLYALEFTLDLAGIYEGAPFLLFLISISPAAPLFYILTENRVEASKRKVAFASP